MTSDTPRTDAVEFQAQPGMMPPYNTVPSNFARTLERELNKTKWELYIAIGEIEAARELEKKGLV